MGRKSGLKRSAMIERLAVDAGADRKAMASAPVVEVSALPLDAGPLETPAGRAVAVEVLEAMRRRRGGLEEATASELLAIFRSLPASERLSLVASVAVGG